MSDETVDFAVLCTMLEAVMHAKKAAMKRKHIRTFLDHVYKQQEYFSAMRLMLPELDRERGTYGLKEAVLAKFLAEALGLAKESGDAQKLLNWRKGGSKAGRNAGNFPMIAAEVLYRRQPSVSQGLKIREINELLDRLSAAQNREEKTATLAEIVSKTNTLEMRWIIMIILKDLKLGVSEKTIFAEFHTDAEDLFNVTCDLKLVCDKLKDRSKRIKRQEIEIGKAVRPQLAARTANVESAWKKLRGKEIVAECKLDGDRIQVHKNGRELHFFSRNFIDHEQYQKAMTDVMLQGIVPEKCILDGEMLVWNRATNRFSDFGQNRGIATAKDGLEGDEQLCYVAFDILHEGEGSVIHQSLSERKELLQKMVHPVKGRLELLLPDDSRNSMRSSGGPPWSVVVKTMQEAEHFFLQTVENRDEGVVLKDMDSKWEPGDRSGKWLKLKPDYINTGSDLDVLIIGGYFGSGRRGGEVAQFLLGLAEKSNSSEYPTRFLSFCKVGSGLSDAETEVLVTKLKPYFRLYEKNLKPPSCYVVTNNSKERPDVWIDSPEKSVILTITSDIRTIKSDTFAAPYSLRFPRVDAVRYDKPWYDCLDLQTLVELVHSSSGRTVDTANYGNGEIKEKQTRQGKPRAAPRALLPSHILVTDVSKVKQTTDILKGLMFYFVNFSSDFPKETMHKMVVENGGSFSMNLAGGVTHVIAAEKKGIKYQAAVKHGDVIYYEWLLACVAQKAVLPLTPKYFMHLSSKTKEKMGTEVDEFGDLYFEDLDVSDLQQIFDSIEVSNLKVNLEEVAGCEQKYCQNKTWCTFRGCRVYFQPPVLPLNSDELKVAQITLKWLELEVQMREGVLSSTPKDASHMVVYSTPEAKIPFETIAERVDPLDRKWLMSKKLHIVSHEWLEKSLEPTVGFHLAEDLYELRDDTMIDYHIENDTSPTRACVENDPAPTRHGEGTPPSHVLEGRKPGQRKRKADGRPESLAASSGSDRSISKRRLSRRLVMDDGDKFLHAADRVENIPSRATQETGTGDANTELQHQSQVVDSCTPELSSGGLSLEAESRGAHTLEPHQSCILPDGSPRDRTEDIDDETTRMRRTEDAANMYNKMELTHDTRRVDDRDPDALCNPAESEKKTESNSQGDIQEAAPATCNDAFKAFMDGLFM